MSTYIKLSTLEYPRHEGDIRLEHPEITQDQTGDSFPCPSTHALVTWVNPPEIDENAQFAYQTAPIEENGEWKMVWAVRNLSQEEIDYLQTIKNKYANTSGSAPNVIG